MSFQFISNNHNSIKQPFIIHVKHQNPLPETLTVYFLSDLTFQPIRYPIEHKITPIDTNKYSIQFNFLNLKTQAQQNDQILNNFGILFLKQLNIKAPMLLVSDKGNIYVTFIQNKKRQNESLAQTK